MLKKNVTKTLNYVSMMLMAGLLILQFTPFWHYGEAGETAVSINEFVWFPTEHTGLEKALSETMGTTVVVSDIIGTAILLLVICVAGIVLCIFKAQSLISVLMPFACGLTALWQYLGNPLYRLGSGWMLHLVFGITLVAVSVIELHLAMKDVSFGSEKAALKEA